MGALLERLKENHLRQQQVLANVLAKAPEQAKQGLQKAIENSGAGLENAVEKIQGKRKMEQFQKKLNLQIRNMDKKIPPIIQKKLERKRQQPENQSENQPENQSENQSKNQSKNQSENQSERLKKVPAGKSQ